MKNSDFIKPEDLPPIILALAQAIVVKGFRVYLVGGWVRDWALGHEADDIDLISDASPSDIWDCLADCGFTSVYRKSTRMNIIGFTKGDVEGEIRTFDSMPFSDDTENEEGIHLEEDLACRDFTANAIAVELPNGRVIDPFSGLADISQRILRFVPNAIGTIEADPVRMLRAVRIASGLRLELDREAINSINKCSSLIAKAPSERVGKEMEKILLTPSPSIGLRLMDQLGLMCWIMPELQGLKGLPQGKNHDKDGFDHTMAVLDSMPASGQLRWAALLHDIGKPSTFSNDGSEIHFYNHEHIGADIASGILRRFHVHRQMAYVISKLIAAHLRPVSYDSSWGTPAVRRLLRAVNGHLADLFVLARADIQASDPGQIANRLESIAELEERCRIVKGEWNDDFKSPLNGDDLVTILGKPPGHWIREAKNHLTDLVLDGVLKPGDKETARWKILEFYRK